MSQNKQSSKIDQEQQEQNQLEQEELPSNNDLADPQNIMDQQEQQQEPQASQGHSNQQQQQIPQGQQEQQEQQEQQGQQGQQEQEGYQRQQGQQGQSGQQEQQGQQEKQGEENLQQQGNSPLQAGERLSHRSDHQQMKGQSKQENQNQQPQQQHQHQGQQQQHKNSQVMEAEAEPERQLIEEESQQQPQKNRQEGKKKDVQEEGQIEPEQGNEHQEQQEVQKQLSGENPRGVSSHPQPKVPVRQFYLNKESYINTIQSKMHRMNIQYQACVLKLDSQQAKIKDLQNQINNYQKEKDQNSRQIRRYEKMQQIETKNKQRLEKQYRKLTEEMQEYRQIGDLTVLKNRIAELETLLGAQKQQIEILKNSQKQSRMMAQSEEEDQTLTIAKINTFKKLQQQNCKLKNDLQLIQKDILEQEQTILQLQSKLKDEKEINWQKGNEVEAVIRDYEGKIQEQSQKLQQQVKRLKEELYRKTVIEVNPEYSLTTSIKEEKEILMREYLLLEEEHVKLQEHFREVKEKYHNAVRENKIVGNMTVSKKEYDDLLKRYKKSKVCLEQSIQQTKRLKEELKSNRISSGRSGVMQQDVELDQKDEFGNKQEKQVVEYHKSIRSHQLSYIDLLKRHSQQTASIETVNLQLALKQKSSEVQHMSHQLKQLNKLCKVYENQIAFKNNSIRDYEDRVGKAEEKVKNYYFIEEESKKNRLQLDNIKTRLRIFEVQNLGLVEENLRTKKQLSQWKHIYETIKSRYEQVIEEKKQWVDKGLNIQQQLSEPMINEEDVGASHQQLQQRQCRKCRQRGGNHEVNTQTDNLNQFYYKQIRQLLTILKKFPKKTEQILGAIEEAKKQLQANKEKYQKMHEKLNIKFKEVRNEKNENEQWRQSAREQIKEEFQDIRELLADERLLNVLRRAKQLIIELQEENEDNINDNGDEAEQNNVEKSAV